MGHGYIQRPMHHLRPEGRDLQGGGGDQGVHRKEAARLGKPGLTETYETID